MADETEIPEELTVTLRKPVELGSITYTELKLREPTADEWEQFDKLTGVSADIKALAIVSGVPEPAVRKIGARDLRKGSKFVASFLFDAPSTGVSD